MWVETKRWLPTASPRRGNVNRWKPCNRKALWPLIWTRRIARRPWQGHETKTMQAAIHPWSVGNRCHSMTAQPASSTDPDVSTPPHYRGSSRASAKKVSLCVSASFSFCTGSGAAKKLQGRQTLRGFEICSICNPWCWYIQYHLI